MSNHFFAAVSQYGNDVARKEESSEMKEMGRDGRSLGWISCVKEIDSSKHR